MHSHNATLYPMLGVGAFMAMFWTGIVVGHEIGLGCASLLIMGLLSACIGTVGVCELQRRDGQGTAASGPARAANRAATRPAPAPAERRAPGAVTLSARSLPIGS